MKAFSNEFYTPPGQDDKDAAKSYEIKALTSLEFAQVLSDGSDDLKQNKSLKFQDVKLLLELGLVDKSVMSEMPTDYLIYTAGAIYQKALITEAERKNS
jgi:hypothetical protein